MLFLCQYSYFVPLVLDFVRGKGFGASVAPPHLWGRYVCTDPRHGWRRLKRKFIFVMSSTRVAQKPKHAVFPAIPRKSSGLSEFFILFPQPTEFHRRCPPFTATTTNLPRGPVFAHHYLHFTPFSNFFKKK